MFCKIKERETMSSTVDKTLTCADCGADFIFSSSEQDFFAERGFSTPRRCKSCRNAAKASRGSGRSFGRGGGSSREMHDVTCAQCGVRTQVPFKPSGDKPVYCRDCFRR